MDFKKLDVVAAANAGFDLQLKHPGTDELLPIFIRVLGMDSGAYRKADAEQTRARLDKVWKGGKFNPANQSPQEDEAQGIQRLIACTTDWWEVLEDGTKRTSLELGGEFIICNPEGIRKMYEQFPWMREQVSVGVADRANFTTG